MIRSIVPVLLVVACTGSEEPPVAEYHPSLEFLAPTDGGSVAAGAVQVSIVVEEFTLAPPEAVAHTNRPSLPMVFLLEGSAFAHNEDGAPTGYCELSLDDVVVGQMDSTQFTLDGVAAGSHTLAGRLLFVDGDELAEPVSASVTFDAE